MPHKKKNEKCRIWLTCSSTSMSSCVSHLKNWSVFQSQVGVHVGCLKLVTDGKDKVDRHVTSMLFESMEDFV
jgi:hypothetical protein